MTAGRQFWYRLDGHTPVPCDAQAFEQAYTERHAAGPDTDTWRVDRTDLFDTTTVSTVFLGLDHQWGSGPPLVFETMVFGSGTEHDNVGYRTSTWEAAQAMHDQLVATVRDAVHQRLGRPTP